MKKIFFAGLMLLMLGGISYAQTPAKTTQKKESLKKEIKPANSVGSVSPSKTAKTTVKAKTVANTNTKTSGQTVPASAMNKHKKIRHKAKKQK